MNAKSLFVCLGMLLGCSLLQAQGNSRLKTAAEQLHQQWSRGQAEDK